MILEPVFLTFCLSFPDRGNQACKQALQAASNQIQLTQNMVLLEDFSKKYINNNIDHKILYSLVAVGSIINSYSNRQVLAQIPIYNYEFDLNLTLQKQEYAFKFQRVF